MQKQLAASSTGTSSTSASASKAQKTGAGTASGRVSAAGGRKEGTRGTKRGREEVSLVQSFIICLFDSSYIFLSNSNIQDDGTRKPEMKLIVPEVLKIKLVDDWEAVTKNGQVRIPQFPLHRGVTRRLF